MKKISLYLNNHNLIHVKNAFSHTLTLQAWCLLFEKISKIWSFEEFFHLEESIFMKYLWNSENFTFFVFDNYITNNRQSAIKSSCKLCLKYIKNICNTFFILILNDKRIKMLRKWKIILSYESYLVFFSIHWHLKLK